MVIDEPEDYYETFAGRGQEDQDAHDLLNGHPEKPGEPIPAWPLPKSAVPDVSVERPYAVMLDDNSRSDDVDTDTAPLDRYATLEEALARCRLEVDRHLRANYRPGMVADDLYEEYTDFGPDPWIRGPALPQVAFSARAYAKARVVEICEAKQQGTTE